ncbi:hypothetical protein WJX84_003292 [Apatococcus fuscideae]|uniref:Uncharacterized protein n=1 Tax=Apatococcus fuscideae TaxID=2026836 RepID=A0AAW1SP25_9CHLO
MADGDFRTPVCFFLVSVAYTIGWTAISSMLAFYKQMYGPQILLQLNTVYFLPSIPVLLLQTQCDARINRSLGIATATAGRLFVGLGGSAIICALYPFYAESVPYLLWVTAFLGVFSGIAFGSSYQLVAYFEPVNTVALTTGYVGSGPIVLLLELFLQIGPQPSSGQIVVLFELVAAFTIAGLLAALGLLYSHWQALEGSDCASRQQLLPQKQPEVTVRPAAIVSSSPRRRTSIEGKDTYGGERSRQATYTAAPSRLGLPVPFSQTDAGSTELSPQALGPSRPHLTIVTERAASVASLPAWPASPHGADLDKLLAEPPTEPSASRIMTGIWPAAFSLFLSVGTSILVFPFFTFVPTSGYLGSMLPQALFAARTVADIVGRLIPRTDCISTRWGMVGAGLVKTAITPLFFVYLAAGVAWRSDVLAIAYIFAFWLMSGYINTCAYLVAPEWASLGGSAKAGALMALTFQSACLIALFLAFALEDIAKSMVEDQQARNLLQQLAPMAPL